MSTEQDGECPRCWLPNGHAGSCDHPIQRDWAPHVVRVIGGLLLLYVVSRPEAEWRAFAMGAAGVWILRILMPRWF
jgi:hypothetical protein